MRLFERHCVSYANFKMTVDYLESGQHLQQVREQTQQRALDLPPDLGVKVRPADYYDQAGDAAAAPPSPWW